MGRKTRKRKVAVAIDEEKENESESAATVVNAPVYNNGPMYKIMSHVQTSEALHKKYIKEMQQLYTKMHHDAFMCMFIRMIKSAMECDETNEYALTSLQFCAKFIASYEEEDTHPILISIFDWLSKTISNNPHIRFRLCQFVNLILTALGTEAALDDAICDKILEYMIERLRDMSPSVRVQAIVAMQRLQAPENPNDPVVRAYQFHLCSDPSPRVRQAVITTMGRNYITIPYILDRLWDIDEKVRRHTYLHMSSYPVRAYKVSQRLMLLEQGLNDRAESVRKMVTKVMLRQWLESYQKDILALVSALKLDANEAEIERFRKVAKQTLDEIFKSESVETLMSLLPLGYEGDYPRCIPHEKLSVELALYWQCLSDFLQAKGADEFDLILPELSVFCAYVENFCKEQLPEEDKFQRIEFQYKLLALLEILFKYDLGDEIGRGNFKNLAGHLLRNISLDDKNIEVIIRCAENLIIEQDARMQFLIEIVQDICQLNKEQNNIWNDRTLINEALANCSDATLNLKLSELKVKILDLEEQEMVCLQRKDFVKAQEVTDEKNLAIEEYTNLLKPLLSQPLGIKKVKNENILTALQIIYHMVVSEKIRSLSPAALKLYNDFICRYIASVQIPIRDWALKCGTAYSMHYEPIAKELFNELYLQFFKHHNARIWETSVKCVFEIMDFYGVDKFTPHDQAGTSSKRAGHGRTLYNTLGALDVEDETQVNVEGQSVGLIHLMSHFLDTCDNVAIVSEIILGFIKLIVHGFIQSGDIIEKLLIRYFNPSTDTKINQYLSIFLEEMIRLQKQSLLVPSLLPTVSAVLTAPYDSPLLEIRPETITRFFIDVTRQDAHHHHHHGRRMNNLHNKIAHAFLTEMLSNTNNKELCKLLAKEILKLELDIRSDGNLKQELMEMCNKLLLCELDVNAMRNLNNFKGMLEGTFNPPERNANDSDEDADDDENEKQRNTGSVATSRTTVTPTSVVNASENNQSDVIQEEHESTLTTSQLPNATQEQGHIEAEKVTNESDANEAARRTSAVSERIENSQNSSISRSTAESAEISQPIPTATPVPVTLFGRQNQIGQHCLRKSLNSSRAQSESESSDQANVPKIRIEVRIDSEKKKTKPNENENEENYNKEAQISEKTTITNTKSRPMSSASGRSLRQLSARRKSISPASIPISDEDDETSSEQSSSEEINSDKDVVPESPQPSRENPIRLNTTNITTRIRRENQNQNKNQNSPTQTPRKTPARKAAQKQVNTPSVVPQSPQPSTSTSRTLNAMSLRLRSSNRKQNSTSESRSANETAADSTQNQTSSNTPNLNSKKQQKPVKSPRKVLYTNFSQPLTKSNRKRRFLKTPLSKTNPNPIPPESPTDSTSSSSSKSPKPKQSRRSHEVLSTKHHSPNRLQQRKSLDNKTTENSNLLNVVRTRSASKREFYLKNIMTRNKKAMPPSKIPVKSSSSNNVSTSRSSSSSPQRRIARNLETQLSGRSTTTSIRSKIPRKIQ